MKKIKYAFCVCCIILLTLPAATQPKAIKPGEIAPGAKLLDADKMLPFNNGAAVIIKGNASGLIDAKGNFIFPYKQFDFAEYGFEINRQDDRIAQTGHGIGAGLFEISEGVVTSKGRIYKSVPSKESFFLSPDGNYIMEKTGSQYVFIDTGDNRSAAITGKLSGFSEGICIMKDDKNGYWYVNLKNEVLNKVPYSYAAPFSEGMACVGKADQFGLVKYGFINSGGDEIIPLQFSIAPSRFSNGLAIAKPARTDEFRYAFIDKKGTIVFKVTEQDFKKYGSFRDFIGGYSFSETHVMSTKGELLPITEFLAKYKLDSAQVFYFEKFGFCDDGKIRFERNIGNGKYCVGFINKDDRTTVDCLFRIIASSPVYFDRASGLSYAESIIATKDTGKGPVYRKGFINKQGIYLIVKDEGAGW